MYAVRKQTLKSLQNPVFRNGMVFQFIWRCSGSRLHSINARINNGYREVCRMITGRGNQSTWRKPAINRPPQIPHDMTGIEPKATGDVKPATNRLSYALEMLQNSVIPYRYEDDVRVDTEYTETYLQPKWVKFKTSQNCISRIYGNSNGRSCSYCRSYCHTTLCTWLLLKPIRVN
jgi:hypothetical protein